MARPRIPFERYLALTAIEHHRTKARHPQTSGFVERFHRTVKEEFLEVALRETFYDLWRPCKPTSTAAGWSITTSSVHISVTAPGVSVPSTVNAYPSVTQEAS